MALRGMLDDAVARLRAQALAVRAELAAARTPAEVEGARRQLVRFRRRYLQTETLVTFYTHAVTCRSTESMARLLTTCDLLASAAIRVAFEPLGLPVPPVLSYVDSGLGASILRHGLRLHDGATVSRVASIKIALHNLPTPTAVLHEAGHQVGFSTNANGEVAAALQALDPLVGPSWSTWASEILADAIAVAAAGFGPVAMLHDVVAGEVAQVYTTVPGDPHPPALLRVSANVAFCRALFGPGPWDGLDQAWRVTHPVTAAPAVERAVLAQSVALLPEIARTVLQTPYTAFGGRSLAQLYQADRVRPHSLAELERTAGPALWTSSVYLSNELLRLLALDTYRIATQPDRVRPLLAHVREWMLRAGQPL